MDLFRRDNKATCDKLERNMTKAQSVTEREPPASQEETARNQALLNELLDDSKDEIEARSLGIRNVDCELPEML